MPIVDLAPPPIDRLSGRPEDFAVTPGKDDIDHGSDTPDRSLLGAAFRQGNIIGSAIGQQDRDITYDREPGFNPWDAIKGTKYEPHWDKFVDIRNSAAADARKRQIDMEDEDQRTIAGAPWYTRMPAELLAGAADPAMLLPGGAFFRGAKGAIAIGLDTAAAAGAASGLQELGLHATQQTRTLPESALNIGASTFLGGLLGAGTAKLLGPGEWAKAVEGIDNDLRRSAFESDRQAIADRLKSQFVAAGFPEDQAAATAAVASSRYVARAERLEGRAGTPAEMFARQGIEVHPAEAIPGIHIGEAQPNEFFQIKAYHGSPHDFDRFDITKIGTGEGAQAYGHGLYFAENPTVAEEYQKNLAGRAGFTTDAYNDSDLGPRLRKAEQEYERLQKQYVEAVNSADPSRIDGARIDAQDAKRSLEARLFEAEQKYPVKGRLYQVSIKAEPEHFLDWDKPLGEQSPEISGRLEKALGFKPNPETSVDMLIRRLSPQQQQEAASALRAAGIPGIKYLDQGSRKTFDLLDLKRSLAYWHKNSDLPESAQRIKEVEQAIREEEAKPVTHNYVVFDDKLIDITHKDGTPVSAAERKEITDKLFQMGRTGEPQGRVSFKDNARIIELFKSANASTGMHEFGHIWLEELMADAAHPQAPLQLRQDRDLVRKWLGAEGDAQLTREQHEQFARGFEQYMLEGKAPSSALSQVLERFRQWLVAIYQHVRDLGVPINDDIRGVMDRLLATDEEIAASRAGIQPGVPASVGAAAREPVSLAENIIAGRAARLSAAATRALNPFMRVLQNPSAASRDIIQRLAEFTGYTEGNFNATASPLAAETRIKRWQGGLTTAVNEGNKIFSDYVKAGGPLKEAEFLSAIGKAMRRDDQSTDPFITKAAKLWRDKVVDPLKDAAVEVGLLPEDVEPKFAPSYFSRMWNRNRIIGEEGRFKNIISEFMNEQIGKAWQQDTARLNARRARLQQELEDLNLSPQTRATRLAEVETALQQHEEGGEAYLGLSEKADQVSEAGVAMRQAKQAGDDTAYAAAKARRDDLIKAGGKDLKDFIDQRATLRGRRRNIDLGAAGIADRRTRILESLADTEEAQQRTLGRMVRKGQKLQRDLDKLDPDDLAERISGLRNQFAELARRDEAAAERAGKADAQKEAAASRARSKRLSDVANRLAEAEGFDRDGAVAELRAAIGKAVAETSGTTLARGERAQRLQERLAALDPERVKTRSDTIRQMMADLERTYYDRWEIRNLGQGVDPASRVRPNFTDQARQIAEAAYNQFTGRTEAGMRPEFLKITTRGPMRDRTFNIPDLYRSDAFGAIEDFLEHDVREVMTRYTRVMGADVEVQRAFGSLDLKDEMDAITRSYDRLRAGVTDPKELLRLSEKEKADKGDIAGVLDAIRGTRQPGQLEKDWGHIVRIANHVQYLQKMGEVVLASLQDAVRPAMVHGVLPYMQTMGQLATNLKAVKLSVHDAQLMGNVAERVVPARLATIAEISDPMARRGPVEAFLANMTDWASKWNGIRLWTDGMKSIAAVMTQNRILGNAVNWAGLDKSEQAYMRFLGIDQGMAERIAARFQEHGSDLHGVRWANVADWGKTDPVARDAFAAAVNKDVDSIIVIPSKADVPLLAHTAVGKTLLQFKSFTLASHQRVMLRGLQEKPSRFISGAIAMTALGMLQVYLKAVSGNHLDQLRSIQDDPGWWAGEAIDRASFLPVFMEFANDFEKLAHVNPIKSPLKVFDKGDAESQKVQGEEPISLFGPSVGTVQDIAKVAGIGDTLYQGKDVMKGQKSAAVRLMPFNSYFGAKQALSYLWPAPNAGP